MWRIKAFLRAWNGAVCRIPGIAFGLTMEHIEDWEYGDYGERFGCDIYYDFVVYFLCWRLSARFWDREGYTFTVNQRWRLFVVWIDEVFHPEPVGFQIKQSTGCIKAFALPEGDRIWHNPRICQGGCHRGWRRGFYSRQAKV